MMPLEERFESVHVDQLPFARVTVAQVIDRIFRDLARGRGGWAITANADHLQRYSRDPSIRNLYSAADFIVADGMPILWAARLMGKPLPERVAGSDLVWMIAERAAEEGRSIYLLGGAPGAAEAARDRLLERWPSIQIAGLTSPIVSLPPTPEEIEWVRSVLGRAHPDIVYVALGAPKSEFLIAALLDRMPKIWWMGVGISLSFLAGHVQRAPRWMQRSGLEFLHRMLQEPGRLARRYLIADLPFVIGLLARSLCRRGRARPSG